LSKLSLNIVSFDVPFPPNYGGAIDVFYKIKALSELNISIILHTFEYGRGKQETLNKYCDKIFYYKRKVNLNSVFSSIPFIIKTRANKELISNLNTNSYPILFEGIHCTYPIYKNYFKNRLLIVRAHNIEHFYYKGLSKSETNSFKKLFFHSESIKLLKYQKIFKKVNYILTISPKEQAYFNLNFPSKSIYIPAFHEHLKINTQTESSSFALYHGDLRVADNIKACFYLVDIFKKNNYNLIIASDFANSKLEDKIKKYKNIEYRRLSTNNDLNQLIKTAHINILPTFQDTGIKLKLINALFMGKFCLVNDKMIQNTGLEKLCTIANSKKEFIAQIENLSKQKFSQKHIDDRTNLLKIFDTKCNAAKIVELLN
jgi:hypothetical protein